MILTSSVNFCLNEHFNLATCDSGTLTHINNSVMKLKLEGLQRLPWILPSSMQTPETSKCLAYTPLKNVIIPCMQAMCTDVENPRWYMQFVCLFHMTERHTGTLNRYPCFYYIQRKKEMSSFWQLMFKIRIIEP